MMTQLRFHQGLDGNPDMWEVAMEEKFKDLFNSQSKDYGCLTYQQIMHQMKIKHPMTMTIMDRHCVYINRRSTPKTFRYNRLIPMFTTWKYPPAVHNGVIDSLKANDNFPDRRVFFMMIATPFTSEVRNDDTIPYKTTFNLPFPGEKEDRRFTDHDRAGSVFSQAFGDDMSKEEEEEPTFVKESKPGPSKKPMTRAQSKGKAARIRGGSGYPGDDHESQEEAEASVSHPILGIDPTKELRDAMIEALTFNRQSAREEREHLKAAAKDEGSGKLEMTEFGWAVNQTMLIRPIIRLWWKSMIYRPYVWTKRRFRWRIKPY
jgi:hypothetical protein